MRKPASDGYILASAIAVLLAISIVAASLVGASGATLTSVHRMESQATEEAALQSAMILLASQLSLDPRRRTLTIEAESVSFKVLERTFHAKMRWESSKLDVNRAAPESTAQLLSNMHLPLQIADRVVAAARHARDTSTPIRLLSDIGLDAGEEACVSTVLTVFGGLADYIPGQGEQSVSIGQPAVGSRLSLDLVVEAGNHTGLSAVVLFTGNDAQPVEVLDWRWSTNIGSEEACNDV